MAYKPMLRLKTLRLQICMAVCGAISLWAKWMQRHNTFERLRGDRGMDKTQERINLGKLRGKIEIAGYWLDNGCATTIINVDAELLKTLCWMTDKYEQMLRQEEEVYHDIPQDPVSDAIIRTFCKTRANE